MPEKEPVVSPGAPAGEEIGVIAAFYALPSVAIIEIKRSSLKVGDTIWVRGHTTDFKETIASMQVDHKPVSEAKEGSQVGVKVAQKVRPHDRVYKI